MKTNEWVEILEETAQRSSTETLLETPAPLSDERRLEFLCGVVFAFDTMNDAHARFIARKAVEVCHALVEQSEFLYTGANEENALWFSVLMNTSFFTEHAHFVYTLASSRFSSGENVTHKLPGHRFYRNGKPLPEELSLGNVEWVRFIEAVVIFSKCRVPYASFPLVT